MDKWIARLSQPPHGLSLNKAVRSRDTNSIVPPNKFCLCLCLRLRVIDRLVIPLFTIFSNLKNGNLPLANEVAEGNVFTHVCLFNGVGFPPCITAHGGGSLHPEGHLHLGEGGYVSRMDLHLGRGSASRGYASRGVCIQGVEGYASRVQQAGGTHLTGMLSFFGYFWSDYRTCKKAELPIIRLNSNANANTRRTR